MSASSVGRKTGKKPNITPPLRWLIQSHTRGKRHDPRAGKKGAHPDRVAAFNSGVHRKGMQKAFKMSDVLQLGTFLGFLVAAFCAADDPQIGQAMANWMAFMPYIFIALMLLAGYFLGKNLAAAHLKKIKAACEGRPCRDTADKANAEQGMVLFQTGSDGMPKVFFHKTKTYNCLKPQRECGDGEEDDMLDNINI